MKAFLLKLLMASISALAPAQGVMLAALTMVAADLVTGVIAAIKRKEAVISSGLKRTLVKVAVYETAIALGFVAQHYLMGDVIPIITIIGGYIGITELTSSYENLNDIAGAPILKAILDKLNKPQ